MSSLASLSKHTSLVMSIFGDLQSKNYLQQVTAVQGNELQAQLYEE